MDFLFTLLAPPLGIIMRGCYALTQNVGVAIILFTIIVRILMFPISVKQEKTKSKSQLFAPKMKEIQTKYRGNQQKMQEEMAKLQKQGYNPAGGCLPMIVTMLILFGVLGVVYNPMTYFENIDKGQIEIIREIAIETEHNKFLSENEENEEFTQEDGDKFRNTLETRHFATLQAQLRAIGVYKENPEAFSALNSETLEKLDLISDHIVFLGIDFSQIPNFTWPIILIPILSFIFATGHMIIMQIIQRKTSPESIEQMGSMKYMLYFMPILSLVIAFQFPAGAGFYWTISSVLLIVQSLIIFKLWPPDKLREELKATLEKQGHNIDNIVVIEKHNGQTTTKKESEMSSSERKEYYRKKLEEARKADLEKYGEVGAPPAKKNTEEDKEV
jgi:YidC/Oxa1 family membrane protein insertase